jgi:hypothetical protein
MTSDTIRYSITRYSKLYQFFKVISKKYKDTNDLIDKALILQYLPSLDIEIDTLEWFGAYRAIPRQCFISFIMEILNETNYMLLDEIIPWYGLSIDNNKIIIGKEDFIITRDNIAIILIYGLLSYLKKNNYYEYLIAINISLNSLLSIKRYSKSHYVVKSHRLGIYIRIYDSTTFKTRINKKQIDRVNDCGKMVNIEIDINEIFSDPIGINSIYDYHRQIYNSELISKSFSKIADTTIKKITCISQEFYHHYTINNVKAFFIGQTILLNTDNETQTDEYILLINNNKLDLIEFLQSYEYIYNLIFITYAYKESSGKKIIDIEFAADMLELDDNETTDLCKYLNEFNIENCIEGDGDDKEHISWIQFIDIVYNFEYGTKPYIVYMMDKLASIYLEISKYLNNTFVIQD